MIWYKSIRIALLSIFLVIPTVAGTQEKRMADRTEVIVTFPKEFPPQCFLDEQGKPVGFAIDVMDAVARLANLKVTYQPAETFVSAVNALLDGSADIVPNSGITPERLLNSDYTSPVETFKVVIFVRDSTYDIHGLDDLKGHKVAVLPTNVGEKIIKKHKEIIGVLFEDIPSALFDLLAGKVDAFIYPEPVLMQLAREARVDELIKIAGEPLVEIKRGIRVRKGDKLLERLNPAVEQFLRSNKYKRIYTKWYGKPHPLWSPARLTVVFAIALGALFFVMFFWRYKSLTRINRQLHTNIEELSRITRELEKANRELKGLDRIKSMFIASMSHEFRTPLNSIIGFTRVVLDGMSGEINAKQREQLNRALRSSQHLLSLVTDIIDISNIEAGRVKVMPQQVLVNEVITEATDMVADAINKKGLLLKVDAPHELHIYIDRKRLLQCLVNLLNNAVKFTESGSVTVRAQQSGSSMLIEVSDTGIGIARADRTKIFEPFERIRTHLYVKAGGAGLGLYLTQKLVTEILHGEIAVESEEGKGSTFRISIPQSLPTSQISECKVG